MIVRQPSCATVGLIQADSVMPLVTFSDAELGTLTVAAPLNASALP